MARIAFFAVAAAMLGAASALEVVSPSEGSTVVAESLYTVEWTGGGSGRFEIDLFYCGTSCVEGDCGEWVTALCDYGDGGCPDTAGNYDVVMPEPMDGTSTGYKVRVMDAEDESNADCSAEFILAASADVDTDGPNERRLIVTSPEDGDMAYAGEEYTVEFDYNNGFGSSIGRFSIDLYYADGNSDCGTWVTSVCDKASVGCKDSMGDYDIILPDETAPGEYKIRVGVFEDEDLFGCSGTFEVVGDGDGPGEFSFFFETLDGGDEDALWWEAEDAGSDFFP